jgi:hypothetical protein
MKFDGFNRSALLQLTPLFHEVAQEQSFLWNMRAFVRTNVCGLVDRRRISCVINIYLPI